MPDYQRTRTPSPNRKIIAFENDQFQHLIAPGYVQVRAPSANDSGQKYCWVLAGNNTMAIPMRCGNASNEVLPQVDPQRVPLATLQRDYKLEMWQDGGRVQRARFVAKALRTSDTATTANLRQIGFV